ncbi:MAG TPA: PLP-dependent aminotransferase family protein [Dictyobacter sp.]|jgi:DNA-binding transcriptional MocR family regulator|nr:PLP-dependent aminotransferase family protein [Dictyobacter sp.]
MQLHQPNHQPLLPVTPSLRSLIQLNRARGVPLYRQISQRLREAILTGELAEGTRLPAERTLAQELGVNRTTIMNAYNDLSADGLIEGHVGRGTLVKRNDRIQHDQYIDQDVPSWLVGLTAGEETILGPEERVLNEIASLSERPGVISLAQGTPDPELLPGALLQSIINTSPVEAHRHALGYCPVEGMQSLRRHISRYMRQRGVTANIQNILILSGSTQGLGLIGRFLLNPGDEVVVEVPTYQGAIQTFRALGAKIIGIPTDNEGIRVDILEAILNRRQPRFIYTLPTFQNPTGIVMSANRKRRLLQLARRYNIPILEDDPYSEIYFEGNMPQPLKALDTQNDVLYLSTYSKILAPGLRVAWLVAPEPVIDLLTRHKQIFDLNTNAIGQWLINELYQRDLLEPHLATIRETYQRKRDLMQQAIADYWPAGVRVNHPSGGMHLWCRLPGDMRAHTLLREAIQEQVTFVTGEPFHVDGGGHHTIRLSFASPEEKHIQTGIQRIGNAMQRLLQQRTHTGAGDQSIERLPMI